MKRNCVGKAVLYELARSTFLIGHQDDPSMQGLLARNLAAVAMQVGQNIGRLTTKSGVDLNKSRFRENELSAASIDALEFS